jgi:hypothetical protein
MNALLALAVSAMALQASETTSSELRGAGWVNSRELTLERLKGKVVVLYFYEAG